jgi:hypothetical protein
MAGKQAKILSDEQTDRLLSFVSTTRNPLRNRVLVLLIPQSRVTGRGDRQTDLADGFGPRRRNCPCSRAQGPRSKEGQRALRFTPICAAPWSRWCKQAVRSVNSLTNVYLLSSSCLRFSRFERAHSRSPPHARDMVQSDRYEQVSFAGNASKVSRF